MSPTSKTKGLRKVPRAASDVAEAAEAVLPRLDIALGRPHGRAEVAGCRPVAVGEAKPPAVEAVARWQDALIEKNIPRRARVLDLGCGGGDLLARLMRLKQVRGQGVELDAEAVMQCVERGVPVLQADLDEGLKGFPEGSFDFVVLEETVQALRHPLKVLHEMLRVGRQGIVSFPNFAYWRVRLSLALEGRMPVTERLPFRWHNTPNIHLFTLQDFLDWTQDNKVRVVKAFVWSDGRARPLRGAEDNRLAEEALFIVARE